MAVPRNFTWACKSLLEMAQIPATPKNVAAFQNPVPNQEWIYAVVKAACPQIGSMTSSMYEQILQILVANGVKVNRNNEGGL